MLKRDFGVVRNEEVMRVQSGVEVVWGVGYAGGVVVAYIGE